MSPLRTFLVSLALALPLIGGAIYVAASGSDVSQTWNNSSDTTSGAPAAGGTGGIPPESLVGARRAAGEAGTQSGFLVTGTGELVAGVDKLTGSANDMTGATKELANGTQQLADGMTQIQAGTGQLGSAASQVADGVDQAVEQVQGVIALQPQLLAAIDDADRKLAANPAPANNSLVSALRWRASNSVAERLTSSPSYVVVPATSPTSSPNPVPNTTTPSTQPPTVPSSCPPACRNTPRVSTPR